MGISRLTRTLWAALGLCAPLASAGCSNRGSAQEPVAVALAALRPDHPGPDDLAPFFAPTERVETFDSSSGFFRVHYTRSGVDAVPPADADRDGVPDDVAQVAREYDAVLGFYRDRLGYMPPLADDFVTGEHGGDGRFDVYLLDFPNSADGAFRNEQCLPDHPHRCAGYMVQENDFTGRNYPSLAIGTRIVASHELFHAVQSAYYASDSVVLSEGTAVWASEAYDGSLSDFESFIDGYLQHTDRSLTQEPTGPVDPFSYGSALFFRFLEEHYDADLIRELWQALADDPGPDPPHWVELLDRVLAAQHQSSLADAFEQFARWNLYTAGRADAAQSYRQGADYPEVTELAVELPLQDNLVRVFPLAAKYYRANVGAAGEFGVAVSAADPEQLAGLRVLLARESQSKISDVRVLEAAPGLLTLPGWGDSDVLHAVLFNTRLAGESSRPAVCLGTPQQLQRCMAELAPAGTANSAGAGGAGQHAAARAQGCATLEAQGGAGLAIAGLALLVARVRRVRARAEN